MVLSYYTCAKRTYSLLHNNIQQDIGSKNSFHWKNIVQLGIELLRPQSKMSQQDKLCYIVG